MNYKVLSDKQPWAWLICAGLKDIENRSWRCPQKYIGERILIHASANKVKYDNWYDSELDNNQLLALPWECDCKFEYGAIIGSVIIADCINYHPSIWAIPGQWHWVLKYPILFNKPILNVKGKLGFWDYKLELCHICGQPAEYECDICEKYCCDNHNTPYNQFTQIDYNCCCNCGEAKNEEY